MRAKYKILKTLSCTGNVWYDVYERWFFFWIKACSFDSLERAENTVMKMLAEPRETWYDSKGQKL